MKLVFGVLSLLVALAIVALIAKQQMHSVTGAAAAPGAASQAGKPANVAEQSRQMQEKVANDVRKALDAGMQRNEERERRNDEADK